MFSHFKLPLHALFVLPLWFACALPANAQTAAPTMAQALDAAWALSPAARAQTNRQAELDARQRAADSFLAAPPALTLRQRSDRANANQGFSETEAELSLPLRTPSIRSASVRQIAAERSDYASQQSSVKLKLAGELRELAASAALATLERDLAARQLTDAQTLLRDVQRRVQAGDSPRIDSLQASAAEKQAAQQLSQAQAALAAVQTQWHALTGLMTLAAPENLLSENTPGSLGTALPEHPAARAAQTRVNASRAQLAFAEADRSDPPELGLGITRERDRRGDAAQNTLQLALRIPFGGDNRNAPRLAAARAEIDTAQAELDAVLRQVQADTTVAQAALLSARRTQLLATERAALSREAQALVSKSYRLGESDLPTRLRLERESFEAELALARAQGETQRAIARLNQSYGILP